MPIFFSKKKLKTHIFYLICFKLNYIKMHISRRGVNFFMLWKIVKFKKYLMDLKHDEQR